MNGQWYTKKWLAVSLHVLFWALLFSFPYLLRPIMNKDTSVHPRTIVNGFYYLNIADNFVRVLLFYANAYLFIPFLVYKKRYGQYFLVLLSALGVMLLVDRFFFNLFLEGFTYRIWNFFVFNLPFLFFIITTSTAFRTIRDRIEENQRIKERETENLKTELSFLRSQVSPHFMFNIMNNMVSLARKKSDLLEPSLIKLSSLLRYMLYETDEKVSLQREIEYLQSYIDLQRQRFGSKLKIKSCMDKLDGNYEIEPMLLIPFVENAFKHGTGLIENPEIDVELKIEKNILSFSVRNTFDESSTEVKDKSSGIGLTNVQRRLALLYNNKHSLLITKQNNWFV
ncbi:MAG TPA: sensor histidine kinase, partial [Chitinophagaceae bacterium]